MPHARCRNCGCFRAPVTEPDLFDARSGLPFPTADDPFLTAIRASQRREADARRRGVTRAIGQERIARRAFTHQALRATQ